MSICLVILLLKLRDTYHHNTYVLCSSLCICIYNDCLAAAGGNKENYVISSSILLHHLHHLLHLLFGPLDS